MAKIKSTDLRERLTALLERADKLYDELDDLLPAYADKIRHSSVPAGWYTNAWRARTWRLPSRLA